jgi:hypothetical protein
MRLLIIILLAAGFIYHISLRADDVSPYEPAAGVYCRVKAPLALVVKYWGNYIQFAGTELNDEGGFYNPSALDFCDKIETREDHFVNYSALNRYHFIIE